MFDSSVWGCCLLFGLGGGELEWGSKKEKKCGKECGESWTKGDALDYYGELLWYAEDLWDE